MGFHNFMGNTPILKSIQQQLSEAKIPSSLLFAGTSGIGKWTLAHYISKALNCNKLTNDFCDSCTSCLKINNNVHLDVKTYSPDGTFIKINQMRELNKEVFFKPFEGSRRVFIIDQAHHLRIEAATSILKTLEEPPETSVMILITDSPSDLLATIRSRCQIFHFSPLESHILQKILKQQSTFASEDIPLVERISEGSLGKALTLDLNQYRKSRGKLIIALDACIGHLAYHQARKVMDYFTSFNQKEFFTFNLDILQKLLRDIFILKIDPSAGMITNIDLHEKLNILSRKVTLAQICGAAQTLDWLTKGLERNLNKTLALDRFLFTLSGLTRPPSTF